MNDIARREQWKPTPNAAAIARLAQYAADRGEELEVTFRPMRVARPSPPARRQLHATNVRSVPRQSPTERALAQHLAAAPQTFSRQGVVPRRSRAIAPAVLGGVAVGAFTVAGGLVWVWVNFGPALLGFGAVVALVLLGWVASGTARHCPGAFHK